MAAKAVRPKARRAKLQVAAAPQREPEDAEEMPPQRPTRSRARETRDPLSSDEEHKESERRVAGELLHGHAFYLARTLGVERRAELRELITQNGGVVVATMRRDTVELVEREQIQKATDADWVAAEFVEDSIRDGELKVIEEYMAKTPLQQALEEMRYTASGRKPKMFYTAKDDATMLQFVHDEHQAYFGRASAPERIWRIAQEKKLLGDRTFNSMHQRYRTKLVQLTKKERAAVYQKAGMKNPETRKETPIKQQQESESQQEAGSQQEADAQQEEGEAQQEEGEAQQDGAEEAAEEKSVPPAEKKSESRPESKKRPLEPPQAEEKGDESVKQQEEQAGKESDTESEIEGRAKKRRKKSSASNVKKEALEALAQEKLTPPHQEEVERTHEEEVKRTDEEELDNHEEATEYQEEQVEQSHEEDASPTHDEEVAVNRSASPAASKAEATVAKAESVAEEREDQEEQSETVRSGEVFRSYWKRVISDPLERPHIERFFTPPSPIAAEISQSTIINSASAAHRTPQRSRRLSHPGHGEEPSSSSPTIAMTPAQRRRARRSSTGSLSTSGSRTPGSRTPGSRMSTQSAQNELLSQLEEVVGQRMTPPRRKSLDRLIPVLQATEDDADKLMKQLQFETCQDANSVCCALYWASGDANVARDFLRGQAPPEMWSPHDDQLLVDYMRADVTEADIANARHRGAFEKMQIKRSARDILRRIQFLQ